MPNPHLCDPKLCITSSFICVCMSVFVYEQEHMCEYVHTWMCVYKHICLNYIHMKAQRQHQEIFSVISSTSFETGYLMILEVGNWAELSGH